MPKEAIFTMNLEPELRDASVAEAEAAHRPASQIVRELMREFIQRHRRAHEYDGFLHQKVEIPRVSMRARRGRPAEEAEAAARIAEILRETNEAGM